MDLIVTHNLNGGVQKMTSRVLYILTLKCTHSTSMIITNTYELYGKCGNVDYYDYMFQAVK